MSVPFGLSDDSAKSSGSVGALSFSVSAHLQVVPVLLMVTEVLVFLPTWAMMSSLSKLLQADAMLSRCKVIMLHSQAPKWCYLKGWS